MHHQHKFRDLRLGKVRIHSSAISIYDLNRPKCISLGFKNTMAQRCYVPGIQVAIVHIEFCVFNVYFLTAQKELTTKQMVTWS